MFAILLLSANKGNECSNRADTIQGCSALSLRLLKLFGIIESTHMWRKLQGNVSMLLPWSPDLFVLKKLQVIADSLACEGRRNHLSSGGIGALLSCSNTDPPISTQIWLSELA